MRVPDQRKITEIINEINKMSQSAEATQGPESCTAVSCESSHTISRPLYKSFFLSVNRSIPKGSKNPMTNSAYKSIMYQ